MNRINTLELEMHRVKNDPKLFRDWCVLNLERILKDLQWAGESVDVLEEWSKIGDLIQNSETLQKHLGVKWGDNFSTAVLKHLTKLKETACPTKT